MPDGTCSVGGCERNVHGRGWCGMHYQRWQAHGDPLALLPVRTTEERFWAKVDKHGPDGFHFKTGENLGPCWLWTATPDRYGYGRLGVGGRKGRHVKAHRFSYELLVGPIPDGLEPDHLCRVRHCVNPDHLEPVTHRTNTLRGVSPAARHAAKTHCPAGHGLTGSNLVQVGWRRCRACHNEKERLRRAAKRQQVADGQLRE